MRQVLQDWNVLRGVSFAELQQRCMVRGYRSLAEAEFNGVHLPDSRTNQAQEQLKRELRNVAERTLRAALTARLRRAGADRNYEPWICLRTFKDKASTPSLDLELDWWDLFRDRERLPSEEEWREMLLPTLQDVKNALGEKPVSRHVHV